MMKGHIGAAPEFVAAGVLVVGADDINSRVDDINLNISCGQPGNIIAGTNCDDGPGRSAGQMCVGQSNCTSMADRAHVDDFGTGAGARIGSS